MKSNDGSQAWTILGFLLLAIGAAFASFLGLMLVFVTDSCGSGNECQTGLIVSGMAITAAGPWLVLLTAVVVATIRRRRGQPVAWVPWIGVLVAATSAIGGIMLAFEGAGPGFL